jgi:hypothetical protein
MTNSSRANHINDLQIHMVGGECPVFLGSLYYRDNRLTHFYPPNKRIYYDKLGLE